MRTWRCSSAASANYRKRAETADWQLLCDEAERLLKPTQDLAMQLAHAYDGIRQQSSRLMTFSGQRCDPLTGLCNRQALTRRSTIT